MEKLERREEATMLTSTSPAGPWLPRSVRQTPFTVKSASFYSLEELTYINPFFLKSISKYLKMHRKVMSLSEFENNRKIKNLSIFVDRLLRFLNRVKVNKGSFPIEKAAKLGN